ncbi:hypothetical protein ACFV99_15160 [Streptomyces sp. NPDC059944]|uniref:hypothetical protein n=1 Tax=unclassified Streptomyces TaxID=2593676 RepID=UPI003658D7F9
MPPGLTAHWALWGKAPRTNSGYKVLAAHPPERSADYNASILHWSPGTPARGDQLPWITIGPGRMPDGTDTVGIFVLDSTDSVDRTNRPIHRIHHFAVATGPIGELSLGWCGLARAALDAAPFVAASGVGPVHLPVGEDGSLLAHVGSGISARVTAGSHWLAAAAACLLDGPVVVRGARDYKPLELLQVLDCVAAMLPFGVRASLSAATGSSSGSQVPMRLYWGDADESPGVTGLVWDGGLPDLDRLSPGARAYFDLLIEAWHAHGAETVVAHLARSREPLDLDSAHVHADALQILSGLNPGLALAQEVRQGHTVDDRLIDDALRHDVFDAQSVAVLSAAKLAGQSTDLSAMARHLPQPEVSQVFWNQLVDDLLDGRLDSARGRFESLREATPDTPDGRDPLDRALACVIDEVRQRSAVDAQDPVVDRLLPTISAFSPGTMAFTQSQLLGIPGLAGRLVQAVCAQQHEPAPHVLAWLRWLCDDEVPDVAGSPELTPLYSLLAAENAMVDPSKRWTEAQPAAATRLLAAAAACGRADRLLRGGFFEGLVACACRSAPSDLSDPSEETPPTLLHRALDRPPYQVRAETAARWDMLCALTGRLPEAFFALTRTPELSGSAGVTTRLAGYASTLQAELGLPLVREHVPKIVAGLLEEILSVDQETGEGPEDTGRELTLRLLEGPGPHTHLVVDAVARLTRNPLWNETAPDTRWLDRIARHRPELAPALSLRTLYRTARVAGNSVEDRGTLAVQLLDAHRAGADSEQLCVPLRSWAAKGPVGERILGILTAYRNAWTSQAGPHLADQETHRLELALGRGPDPALWQAYIGHAVDCLNKRRAENARRIQELAREQKQMDLEIDRLRRLDAGASHTRP